MVSLCVPLEQRACYLSLNPQKDETLETEKAQYILPDGSSLNVSVISWTVAEKESLPFV